MPKKSKAPAIADPAAQRYEHVAIRRLKPHPKNPRRGDVDAIEASIDENGFFGAVLAQRSTRFILKGNHTIRAAERRGMKSIPVIWLDVDDARAEKILLADNAIPDRAEYDTAALAEMLQSIAGEARLEHEIDAALAGTGYDAVRFEAVLEQLEAAEPKEPKAPAEKMYVVAIECDSEARQIELADRLTREGYKVTARRLGR